MKSNRIKSNRMKFAEREGHVRVEFCRLLFIFILVEPCEILCPLNGRKVVCCACPDLLAHCLILLLTPHSDFGQHFGKHSGEWQRRVCGEELWFRLGRGRGHGRRRERSGLGESRHYGRRARDVPAAGAERGCAAHPRNRAEAARVPRAAREEGWPPRKSRVE